MNLKSTGIIRRVDDLGRILFLKQLRQELEVHEGDPFELCVAEFDGAKAIVAMPYRPTNSKLDKAGPAIVANATAATGCPVGLIDRFGTYTHIKCAPEDRKKICSDMTEVFRKMARDGKNEDFLVAENDSIGCIAIRDDGEVVAGLCIHGPFAWANMDNLRTVAAIVNAML